MPNERVLELGDIVIVIHTLQKRPARTASILASAALAALLPPTVRAQIRIASYNIDADQAPPTKGPNSGVAPNEGTTGVLQGLSEENYNGITEPLDILTLQETTSNTVTVQPLVNFMNTLGYGSYAMSTLQGTDDSQGTAGNGPSAVIYNSSKLQLIQSVGVGTPSSGGAARQIMRYEFQPVAYAPPSDMNGNPVAGSAAFYVYVDHMKADSGSGNETRRNNEAKLLRADAATLPAGSRIIYTGDYNLTAGSSEPALATMYAAGTGSDPGQAIDPVYGTSSWTNTNNSSYTPNMSEATGFNDSTGALGTGTLSARFDVQLGTNPTMDGHGFSLINGSYHIFGNTSVGWGGQVTKAATPNGVGTVTVETFNSSGTLTSTGTSTIQNALGLSTDHYPVVADYRLPASMGVGSIIASRVIVGATNIGTITVTNNAPVAAAIDADTLSYSVTTTGSFSGNASGTDLPALSSNIHTLALAGNAAPGIVNGTINLAVAGDSVNQEVQNVPSSLAISTTVVSHAHPSLSAAAGVSSITIDFGTRAFNSAALGLGTPSATFAVNNVADVSGYTAALNLNSILGSGNVSQFSTNAAPFSNLAASGSQSFSTSLLTGSYGSFSASYTLNLSDENIPGATNTAPLVVNLVGRIAAAGDVNDDGTVNALDFNSLASNFGRSGKTWSNGDFNGDGIVNSIDFDALAANFGDIYTPNPAALPGDLPATSVLIPEPATACALSVLLLASSFQRTRRRRS